MEHWLSFSAFYSEIFARFQYQSQRPHSSASQSSSQGTVVPFNVATLPSVMINCKIVLPSAATDRKYTHILHARNDASLKVCITAWRGILSSFNTENANHILSMLGGNDSSHAFLDIQSF